jgi:exonuclease III
MSARPRKTVRCKALRLACWNADGVRGRKLELEYFLSQHGVDICLLSETFLNAGEPFRLANYVCHRTERPTAGGGTAILVRRGIVHHSLPVPALTHLEATAVQVTLAGRPVKILAAYLSPSRPLSERIWSFVLAGCWRS